MYPNTREVKRIRNRSPDVDAAGFFPVNGDTHESAFENSCKIVGCPMLRLIIFCDAFQRFPELKHGGELMLAGIAAEAAAGQVADFAIYIFKFQLVDLTALHDRTALGAVKADVPHAAFRVIVMAALRDITADLHGRKVIQLETGIIIAGSVDITRFIRRLEPGNDFRIGEYRRVKGDEMGPGKEKLALDLCVRNADHALVIGQLDLEVVSDIYHTATQPFELPLMLPMDKLNCSPSRGH